MGAKHDSLSAWTLKGEVTHSNDLLSNGEMEQSRNVLRRDINKDRNCRCQYI